MLINLLKNTNLTFPIALDLTDRLLCDYLVHSLPTTYFIDKNGVIQDIIIGGPIPLSLLRIQARSSFYRINIMFPIIQIGPLSIPAPAFMLLTGFIAGSYLLDKKARSFSVDSEIIDRALWIGYSRWHYWSQIILSLQAILLHLEEILVPFFH